MRGLILAFFKIFFRNTRAIFFVILLPAGLFLILIFLGLQDVIRHELALPYQDFLLTGIIAMALMQTGIYTVAYSLIEYRRNGILKRLSVTPLSGTAFLWAQIFARFLVACLQVAVMLVLGLWLADTNLKNLYFLPVIIFFGSAIFLNLGFVIASFARDYEEAAPYTTLAGLPLVFWGDVFFSVGNLPPGLQQIAQILPLAHLSSVLRYFLLGAGSSNVSQDILILLLWFTGTSILAHWVFVKKAYR